MYVYGRGVIRGEYELLGCWLLADFHRGKKMGRRAEFHLCRLLAIYDITRVRLYYRDHVCVGNNDVWVKMK